MIDVNSMFVFPIGENYLLGDGKRCKQGFVVNGWKVDASQVANYVQVRG